MRSVATILLFIILITYVGLMLFAWFFANGMIFQPPPASYNDGERIIKLASGDESIAALHLPNPDARYTILLSHGNAVDLGSMYPILNEIKKMGFSVFAYDYRGYGTSSGRPSEQNAYRDIDAAYEYLTKEQNTAPEKIIALGQSLGGAMAADLASRKPVGGLILESTFVTAYRVLTKIPLLPFDQFENINKIKQVRCPVLVIHGKQDQVIPFWHGKKLFEQANEPKKSYWVERAGHNNLLEVAGPGYRQALQAFAELIEP